MKASMDIRVKSVVLYLEGVKTGQEISSLYNISERTLRRWCVAYRKRGLDGLKPQSTKPKKTACCTSKILQKKILKLKQKYPAWGARRIKHQFNLPVCWRTIHRFIKKKGLFIRIKPKPQPCKRFQRKHVDSLWQCDTFEFRIHDVGKVYVTGFTDDCSRYRVCGKAYLHKRAVEAINCLQWALRHKRKPKAIYLDNGSQFIAKTFKTNATKKGIKLIYGKPFHPRGRGKIEKYHSILYRELISLKQFKSLSHFRKQLWLFDHQYNNWRKQEPLGWQTPANVYFNKKYFNKKHNNTIKKRTNVLSTN